MALPPPRWSDCDRGPAVRPSVWGLIMVACLLSRCGDYQSPTAVPAAAGERGHCARSAHGPEYSAGATIALARADRPGSSLTSAEPARAQIRETASAGGRRAYSICARSSLIFAASGRSGVSIASPSPRGWRRRGSARDVHDGTICRGSGGFRMAQGRPTPRP